MAIECMQMIHPIVSGLGTIENLSLLFIAQEKGQDTKSRIFRNYGMPKPEGYRKAQRLMKLAEKFSMPIVTIIDTPGAYPGIGAEEKRAEWSNCQQSLFRWLHSKRLLSIW
ncbi:MAG: hypothetical protein Ct9H300mP4_13330 [Gammaproteobacteria bacterium]|nr:MAG: hypothetical protein Ct9H300mP4_13330 [Gammaproteobacteria bacterium]